MAAATPPNNEGSAVDISSVAAPTSVVLISFLQRRRAHRQIRHLAYIGRVHWRRRVNKASVGTCDGAAMDAEYEMIGTRNWFKL